MNPRILGLGLLLAGATSASAQTITDATRAIVTRDSLLRAVETIHLQLAQKAGFELKTPNHKRRHLARGFTDANQLDPETGKKRKMKNALWKHRIIYRRNGRVEEQYTAYDGNRPFLKEQRLNGELIWLSLTPTNGQTFAQARYVRGGYLMVNKRQYLLPAAVEVK